MELSEILIALLFLVVGIVLFRGAMRLRLRLEQEVKYGVVLGNFLPYWNSEDFSETGNLLRKKYNYYYYALVVYSLVLLIYMKTGE